MPSMMHHVNKIRWRCENAIYSTHRSTGLSDEQRLQSKTDSLDLDDSVPTLSTAKASNTSKSEALTMTVLFWHDPSLGCKYTADITHNRRQQNRTNKQTAKEEHDKDANSKGSCSVHLHSSFQISPVRQVSVLSYSKFYITTVNFRLDKYQTEICAVWQNIRHLTVA